jgi:hypothetical protein
VDIPQPDPGELFFNTGRDFGWIFHLRIGGDNNIALARALDGVFAAFGVDRKIELLLWLFRLACFWRGESCPTTLIISLLWASGIYS